MFCFYIWSIWRVANTNNNPNDNRYNSGCLFKSQVLELSWGHGSSVFLSWTVGRTSSSHDSYEVELCHQLGEKLGLKDREQVQSCHSMCSILLLCNGTFRQSSICLVIYSQAD